MDEHIDKYYLFKSDFNQYFQTGFILQENYNNIKFNFMVACKLLGVDEDNFISQFILTNLSEHPYSIDDFNMAFESQKSLEKINSDLKDQFPNICFLRQNEAIKFVEKFKKSSLQTRVEFLIIEINVSGYKKIKIKKELATAGNI